MNETMIENIKRMIDRNAHTEARIAVANHFLGCSPIMKNLLNIYKMFESRDYLTMADVNIRRECDYMMFEAIRKSNPSAASALEKLI